MNHHSGLRYLFYHLNLNVKQARWLATPGEFEFDIRYIKGKENIVANAINGRVQVNHVTIVSSYRKYLQDQIVQPGHHDDKYQQLKHKLQQGTSEQDVDYHIIVDGSVRFRDRVYVLNDSELNKLILREFHVKPYSSHPRYQKTLTTVKKLYYWTNLKKEVATFIPRCLDSQQVESQCKFPTSLLQPIPILEWKWEVISMDFITVLSRTSKKYDSIMVVVDRLRNIAHFIPIKTTNSAKEVSQVFITEIERLHSIPKKIISDRMPSSLLTFESRCLQVWEQNWPSVQLIIHRLLDIQGGSTRYWRICWGCMSCTNRGGRRSIFHWWSLFKTMDIRSH